ncbi:MAG TPA: hypothetical protein VFU22_05325 [Roseiflexaceae bacterium]|nr:hypothetical protein [Roseiflexaceae bacterium]
MPDWLQWTEFSGGAALGRPTVGTNQDERLEVFVRGLDNACWRNFQTQRNGSWSGWQSLGGGFKSNPVVGRNDDGRLEVFARGLDDALWHTSQTSPNRSFSSPSVWTRLGDVQFVGDPVVGVNEDGRLEVFVRDRNDLLEHIWQTSPNGPFSEWARIIPIQRESADIQFVDDPAVGRNRDGRLEVFVRARNKSLWHIWQTSAGGNWSEWRSDWGWNADWGGDVGSKPVVAANFDGRLEVFFRDGAPVGDPPLSPLLHVWQTIPNGTWHEVKKMPGLWRGDPSVILNRHNGLEVFGVGADDYRLWHTMQTGQPEPNGWTQPELLVSSGGLVGPLRPVDASNFVDHAVGRSQDDRLEVFARREDQALLHIKQKLR